MLTISYYTKLTSVKYFFYVDLFFCKINIDAHRFNNELVPLFIWPR